MQRGLLTPSRDSETKVSKVLLGSVHVWSHVNNCLKSSAMLSCGLKNMNKSAASHWEYEGGSKPFPFHPSPLLLLRAQLLSRNVRWGWLRSSPATSSVQRFGVSLSRRISRPARYPPAQKGRAAPRSSLRGGSEVQTAANSPTPERDPRRAGPSAKENVQARARGRALTGTRSRVAATQDITAATQRRAPVVRPRPRLFTQDPRPRPLHRPGDPKSFLGDDGKAGLPRLAVTAQTSSPPSPQRHRQDPAFLRFPTSPRVPHPAPRSVRRRSDTLLLRVEPGWGIDRCFKAQSNQTS